MAWTWEEHQLSEGFSCIVYDECGSMIADHLDRDTAAKIAASPELLEALKRLVAEADKFRAIDWHDDVELLDNARAAIARAGGAS